MEDAGRETDGELQRLLNAERGVGRRRAIGERAERSPLLHRERTHGRDGLRRRRRETRTMRTVTRLVRIDRLVGRHPLVSLLLQTVFGPRLARRDVITATRVGHRRAAQDDKDRECPSEESPQCSTGTHEFHVRSRRRFDVSEIVPAGAPLRTGTTPITHLKLTEFNLRCKDIFQESQIYATLHHGTVRQRHSS
jgi:hypothetical protein